MLSNSKSPLQIALRAYARPMKQAQKHPKRDSTIGFSEYRLVFDTETTVGTSQRFRVGSYQVYKGTRLRTKGFFHDPQAFSSDEFDLLTEYASQYRYDVLTKDEFIWKVFLRYVYELHALCIGFNLPFDIARIARRHNTAKKRGMRGGFSFCLSENRAWPYIVVKHLNSRMARIKFAVPWKQKTPRSRRNKGDSVPAHPGYFVDVRTLASALLSGSWSLETLADHLETKHRKLETGEHGESLTARYLEYLAQDVQATWECFEKLHARYVGYGLANTLVNHIYSEASLGKAYLRQMGIRPWEEVQPGFPPEQTGIIMSTYYGGRSEVHVRREITRVVYCDFLSMYPTVCTLMHLWSFVTAQGIEWFDSTEEARTLLDSIDAADLRNPEVWKSLAVFVRVQPDDDVLPVRAKYNKKQHEPKQAQYSIGVNHLESNEPVWYTLADCIQSKILTGCSPKVLQAVGFRPLGVQQDLHPIAIAGNPEFVVNPIEQDFYKRLIEMRSGIKAKMKSCPQEDKPRLDTEQQAIKLCANATSYGIFMQLNVNERAKREQLACFGNTGECFPVELRNVEEPGEFFHPLLGTLITGAARLMLAIAERLIQDAGLTWAFCDTDSMALAKPGDMPDEEFQKRVARIVDWFTPLNPYDAPKDKQPDSILKVEDENYRLDSSGQVTKEPEPLYCFAVSAKRYALFNIGPGSLPIIRKASAHGLGHLLPPYGEKDAPDSIPKPQVRLDKMGVERWQYDLWYRIVQAALEGHPAQVCYNDMPGFDKPAATRYAATTPVLLKWFEEHNAALPYEERVKPFGFVTIFHPKRQPHKKAGASSHLRVVAPYDKDPAKAAQNCFDCITGNHIAIEQLQTYREAIAQYHLHCEAKFDNGDYTNSGMTYRKHVIVSGTECIGKEANRWEEQAYLGVDPEEQIIYGISAQEFTAQYLPVLDECRKHGVRKVATASGIDAARVSRLLVGNARMTARIVKKLQSALVRLADKTRQDAAEAKSLFSAVKSHCASEDISIREFARRAEVDHGNLLKALTGKRKVSKVMLSKLESYLRAADDSH
ncbi:hypothetical protein LLG46_05810 [bacterium]|nr:hypothetical protein [bacterium]